MPAPAHTRVTFSGVFGGTSAPVEIWSTNLSLSTPPGQSNSVLASSAASCVSAWNLHLRPHYSNTINLVRVRIALVGSNGLVERGVEGAYRQADADSVAVGSGTLPAGGRKPLQTALVVSLITPRAGSNGKGRMFLPFPDTKVLQDDFSSADTDALATSARSFLQAVKTGTGGELVVASGGSTVTGQAPVLTAVTSLRVGRVPDTMRSRRSAAIEGYSTLAF